MIILKNNSTHFCIKTGDELVPIEESLICCLSEEIEIEKGVKFEDFFNIILKHHEEYSKVFQSYLSGVQLAAFLPEWQKDYIKEDNLDTEMQEIAVAWENLYILNEKELLKDLDMSSLPSFIGRGVDKDNQKIGFGIEFTPLNKLKKYPFILVPDTDIINLKTDKTLVHIERSFTVFDVLAAIFYEITFCGDPSERDEKLNDIADRAEELKKEFDNTGKNDTISLDELLKNLNIDKPKE